MRTFLIIGAGQTGRGFIPQFIEETDKIVFIDNNKELVDCLSSQNYTINFYGNDKYIVMENYEIMGWDNVNSEMFESSDFICISIGEHNYSSLIDDMTNIDITRVSNILMFENGVNPAKKFEEMLFNKGIEIGRISQCAVFTTTNNDGINIKSEDNQILYYDASRWKEELLLKDAVGVDDFEKLLERKIFTYNLLSAYFAYNGYEEEKRYLSEIYSNEEFIRRLVKFKEKIDKSYSKYYDIGIEEQTNFSQSAVIKFSNQLIKDDITRNARDVKRKISDNERISGPYKILKKYGESVNEVLSLLKIMIAYGIEEENYTDKELIEQLTYLEDEDRNLLLKELEISYPKVSTD